MRETILLFGFSKERQSKLMRALLPLKMRIKRIEQDQLGQPLGVLAGQQPAEEKQSSEKGAEEKQSQGKAAEGCGQALGDEMLVMAGLTSARVDAVLAALRKGKTGPIPYKAVLTETNQQWNAWELLEELKQEHARFTEPYPQ
ncbi:MAG: DUF3783 domain-containing protein [Lachnospiraceae bacterium]|nr:DUF3783 domain-containing protein [Lachnospiraceae bacterium]